MPEVILFLLNYPVFMVILTGFPGSSHTSYNITEMSKGVLYQC
jgi:hypothetical protein